MPFKKIKIRFIPPSFDPYDVVIGKDLFKNGCLAGLLPPASRYAIIADSTVKKLYGLTLLRELRRRGLNVELLSFPVGESSKNQEMKTRLEHGLLKRKRGRDTLIIALGGGVTGDLAGFTAATYLRGVPYVQIPTTFLAMADSSVGGKTAINTPYGKNMIGAFWQPKKVIIDLKYLDSLTRNHLINGLIEAEKMFLTNDEKTFFYAFRNFDKILKRDKAVLGKIISRAVTIKAGIVSRDPDEKGERMVLNFGHTIGHALELLSDFKLLHGYAVGLGILAEAKISQFCGFLRPADCQKIEDSFSRLDIGKEWSGKFRAKDVMKVAKSDKKGRAGKTRYVLLEKIGRIAKRKKNFTWEVDDDIVIKALNHFFHG